MSSLAPLPNQLHIYTDGGARGNPGPSALGMVAFNADKQVFKFGRFLGNSTNNQAEYFAVLDSLSWLLLNQKPLYKEVTFFIDSLLVVNQLNGKFKVKNSELKSLFLQCQQLLDQISIPVTFTHIRREKNSKADEIVNIILDSQIPSGLFA